LREKKEKIRRGGRKDAETQRPPADRQVVSSKIVRSTKYYVPSKGYHLQRTKRQEKREKERSDFFAAWRLCASKKILHAPQFCGAGRSVFFVPYWAGSSVASFMIFRKF